ncbi:hypothetical protein QC764_301230 [Podospora pseudoanserina]|uniref:DUF4139 domain-containing protein n=1 Tax=Podospora pseudoanserina TaxID=2609844 RepID=A0ABR0IBH1_9PEZI|nr:hypothetical protein QC764_301230 [Podospora pseudoanserina]
MDFLHEQQFHIRDLPTRTVTLFPTRAQVVRDIKEVALKPGANEIAVVGLSPTVDEESIKVEGIGSAIITDITIELLPNRDIFEEIYPDSDSDSEEDESEEDDEFTRKTNDELKAVRDSLQTLYDKRDREDEIIESAINRQGFLESYGRSLEKKKGNFNIDDSLEMYRKERDKTFEDKMSATIRKREIAAEIDKLQLEEARLLKLEAKEQAKINKAKAKVQRAKDKVRAQKFRRMAKKEKEKARIRKEREQFWPKSCYTIRVTLDATSLSPSSSRRSSVASAADVKLAPEKPMEDTITYCDLSLSYVTTSAFWSPSYDLALSTTTNSAILCFDAQLTNMTSETWTNAKVILSTSQASFSGLHDESPRLLPWRIKLGGRAAHFTSDQAIYSREERTQKEIWNAAQNNSQQQKPRAELFGVSKPQPHGQFYTQGGGEGVAFALLGKASSPPPPPSNPAPLAYRIEEPDLAKGLNLRSANMSAMSKRRRSGNPPDGAVSESMEYEDYDAQTVLEPTPEVSFQDSSFEETGLTATYDLPNPKTLRPSSTASKQRVARITFSNVVFARTVVAKYKPAAYLKAKLRNTSKLTLLKGPTGLTLDGTFMGRSTLPRCSAGDTFKIPLGVDPAIKVAYPKPEVKRSTTGVFTKGHNSVYTRAITLVNTRAAQGAKPVEVLVLDQVPVSEDEKLRVELLHPRMSVSGGGMSTGVPGKDGKEEANWGKAVSFLKKGGEVNWEVVLNAGRSVKLTLEYTIEMPSGEKVVEC